MTKSISKNRFFSSRTKVWNEPYVVNDETLKDFNHFAFRKRKDIVFDFIDRENFSEPKNGIDVGCGAGFFLSELINRNFTTIGSDITLDMVKLSRNNNLFKNFSPKMMCADCTSVPFQNDHFDALLCIGVLSYVPDELKAIKEFQRVVKKNGIIILSYPALWKLKNFFDPYYYITRGWKFLSTKLMNLFKGKDQPFLLDKSNKEFVFRRYRLKDIDRVMKEAGIINYEVRSYGYELMRVWRKQILPIKLAIRISYFLEKLQKKKQFRFLKQFASGWVVCIKN